MNDYVIAIDQGTTSSRAIVFDTDFRNLATGQQEFQQLERKLRDYARETSTQIAIVAEPSLEGEDPFDYSYRLSSEWGIGGGEYDNGILIYIAEEERDSQR